MIQLKPINYTNASSIDVEAIVENLRMLASEIESSRSRKNVIPTGIGSISVPIMTNGRHTVIPRNRLRLDILSAHVMIADNIRRAVKVALYINERKVAKTKFGSSERSGKIQIFDLPDDLELGIYDEVTADVSDGRRMVVTVTAATKEDETDG